MFAAEKPHLQPLPFDPFRYSQYDKRTIHIDPAHRLPGPATYLGGCPVASKARSRSQSGTYAISISAQ